MNKGQTIRSLIEKGMTNEQILGCVDTTINSIRWHRSKMAKASFKPAAPKTATSTKALRTVGDVIDQHGFGDTILNALKELNVPNPDWVYQALCRWSFKVNKKATSRYGLCNYTKRFLEVNALILDIPEDFRNTFLHECAHALDKIINGKSSSHGGPWQKIMRAMGLSTSRHSDHTAAAAEAVKAHRAKKAYATWVCNGCGAEAHIMRKRKYAAEDYIHGGKSGCGGNYSVKATHK